MVTGHGYSSNLNSQKIKYTEFIAFSENHRHMACIKERQCLRAGVTISHVLHGSKYIGSVFICQPSFGGRVTNEEFD